MTENNPFRITPIPADTHLKDRTDESQQQQQQQRNQRYQQQLPPPTPTSPCLPPLSSPTISIGRQQQISSQTASLLTPSSPKDQQTQFPAPTSHSTSTTTSIVDASSSLVTGPTEPSKIRDEPGMRNVKIRKNACVVCSICFTCAKFYGTDCQCPEVQPRRGKNLPEGGLDSRAKKLHRKDQDDYEFSVQWISENAHPMYRDKQERVLGLRELSEVSLCKAHSSTLYRAKKRHERNMEEDGKHTNTQCATGVSTSTMALTSLQGKQQQASAATATSEKQANTQPIGMPNNVNVPVTETIQSRTLPITTQNPLNEYSSTRNTPATTQALSPDGTMNLTYKSASNKRKRSVCQHCRTQSPSRINTNFQTQPSQSRLSCQQFTITSDTNGQNSGAYDYSSSSMSEPQHTLSPPSTAYITSPNITPPVHTIPSQQHLLDRLSSQLPPLQTSSTASTASSTSTTSIPQPLQQPIPIHPHYSLVQQSPVSAAGHSAPPFTPPAGSVGTSSPPLSMIPPTPIPLIHHPQPHSVVSPYTNASPSFLTYNHADSNNHHPLQQDTQEMTMTSPKSHDSISSTNNANPINRPSSSHSRTSRQEEENDRIVVETVSLRPSLPIAGSAASPTSSHGKDHSTRYYCRNLAITHNFTFRDLLAEIDIQGSPPPPGKRIVISDPLSDRIYPLDQPIRDVITRPTSTHIELCLGLTDKPFIDWSAYS